jgi:hypothetical protein
MHGDTVNHFYQSLPTDLNIYHTYLATLCEEDGQEGREPVGIGSQCGVLEPVTTRQKTCPHQVRLAMNDEVSIYAITKLVSRFGGLSLSAEDVRRDM